MHTSGRQRLLRPGERNWLEGFVDIRCVEAFAAERVDRGMRVPLYLGGVCDVGGADIICAGGVVFLRLLEEGFVGVGGGHVCVSRRGNAYDGDDGARGDVGMWWSR